MEINEFQCKSIEFPFRATNPIEKNQHRLKKHKNLKKRSAAEAKPVNVHGCISLFVALWALPTLFCVQDAGRILGAVLCCSVHCYTIFCHCIACLYHVFEVN